MPILINSLWKRCQAPIALFIIFFKKTLHSMVAIEKQRTLYLDTKENVISVVEFFLGVFLCADPAGGVAG